MVKLKPYTKNMEAKLPERQEPEKSGVACTEKKCKGEMLIQNPKTEHPQLKGLHRAICNKCGWRGWV